MCPIEERKIPTKITTEPTRRSSWNPIQPLTPLARDDVFYDTRINLSGPAHVREVGRPQESDAGNQSWDLSETSRMMEQPAAHDSAVFEDNNPITFPSINDVAAPVSPGSEAPMHPELFTSTPVVSENDQMAEALYVSPLSRTFGTRAASLHLRSLTEHFPGVSAHLVLRVSNHTLHPLHLYRLDTTRDDAPTESGIEEAEALKLYPTFVSLFKPLLTYFNILIRSIVTGSASDLTNVLVVTGGSFNYIAHLSHLKDNYRWCAVLRYHIAFFLKRAAEMKQGNYRGWESIEHFYLVAEHLSMQEKWRSRRH